MKIIPVGDNYEALVDDCDHELLSSMKWYPVKTRGLIYAAHWKDTSNEYMHRLLCSLSPGDNLNVDHIDRNGLNNQRSNLRVVTHSANHQNVGPNKTWNGRTPTSKYRGVLFSKKDNLWIAKAQLNYKYITIGYFKNEEQAGRVAAEWRRQNMPYSNENGESDPEAAIWLEEANARRRKK